MLKFARKNGCHLKLIHANGLKLTRANGFSACKLMKLFAFHRSPAVSLMHLEKAMVLSIGSARNRVYGSRL